MTLLGLLLIGIAIGRALGPSYLWANILTALLGLAFMTAGQVVVMRKVIAAKKHIQWHMENPDRGCEH